MKAKMFLFLEGLLQLTEPDGLHWSICTQRLTLQP